MSVTSWKNSRYRDCLRAGWSEVRIPVGASYFSLLQNVQTSSGAKPDTYSIGTGLFLEGNVAGA